MKKVRKLHKISTKIILIFVVMVLIMIFAIGFVIYKVSYRRVLDNVNDIAAGTGEFISATVDTDKMAGWLENGVDGSYEETARQLAKLNSCYGLNSVYVFVPTFDEHGNMLNNMITLFDISRSGDTSQANFDMLGTETGEVDVFEQCRIVYQTGKTLKSDIITRSEEFGWLSSCYIPILNDKGEVSALVGIDSEMTTIIETVLRQTLVTCGLIFLLVAAFAVIFIVFIENSVVKPVKRLSDSMNKFVSGGGDLNFTPITGIKTNDEIEQMSEDFNSMAKAILEYTENLEKSVVERERLQADLDVAAQIRISLSGGTNYPAFPNRTDFELFASMKNTVFNKSSFCDCFMIDDSHLFLIIGESPGRSLASMLNVMFAATNIRCFARMGYRPRRIAMETNNLLCGQGNNDKGLAVDAIIAEIDLKSGVFEYVNAGMPPMLLKKTGESFSYNFASGQFSLGEMPNISFSPETIRLSQGNSILFMSNGVLKMENENGIEFSETNVMSEINRIAASKYTLKDITEELESSLESFRGNVQPELDTSLIAFRYLG